MVIGGSCSFFFLCTETHPDDDKRMAYNTDESKRIVILKLIHDHNFIQLLLDNLCRYQDKAAKILHGNSLANSRDAANINNMVLDGVYPHLERIQSTLDFLRYLLVQARGAVLLTTKEVDLLWEHVVVRTLTSEEREVCNICVCDVCCVFMIDFP